MTLEDYMKLPYTSVIREMNDESGHYCIGRINVRIPKSLHERLVMEAKLECKCQYKNVGFVQDKNV